ncbi:epoxyqueuosine reductase [Geomesophilobacter sediminis]|uniref:Epoxyqueuosine reductase n=1 Tax=Geomesophilobacter sediminis TaxID=2798584 RepID=A0A8J7M3C2_9BACT|nr:epoxyqueuosine reductase [Geomesophilobacter sediminis]MBJ6728010.1 epoxyqueuosine reductase [Geomesophilobacter sediminis]
MNQAIREEIERFVAEDDGNRHPEAAGSLFDVPLVGFAVADDPLFATYKKVIGDFHLTPLELCRAEEVPWVPRTVISWVLPISEAVRRSNAAEQVFPSRPWAVTRTHGEAFNGALRRHLVTYLKTAGFHALAPQFHPSWQEFSDTAVGRASSWSERHAAYAAGLGTFSLNDALITPRGIAHRCGSVITDAPVVPSEKIYRTHTENCLYFRDGSCGACIGRCPVGALSRTGHDKEKCKTYVYETAPAQVGQTYGVAQTGCGLCQTRVPCEAGIPGRN